MKKLTRREWLQMTSLAAVSSLLPRNLLGGVLPVIDKPYDCNRVVRVYDAQVSDYDFSDSATFWDRIDTGRLQKMLRASILKLSRKGSEKEAWDVILAGGKRDDLASKRVAVKVNFNNTIQPLEPSLNNTPAMMTVIARSLIGAGVREDHITFFDPSRPFPELFKQKIRDAGLKSVNLLGNKDNIAESDKMIRLTDNAGHMRDGKSTEFMPIPQLVIDADCLINLHLVKVHYSGVTASMKNLVGLAPDVGFFMHNKGLPDFTNAFQLVDITLNDEIKKRSVLNIAEFIYGGHSPNSIDKFTDPDFFPSGRPSSIIVSRSPFYQDIVCYDFIRAEYLSVDPAQMLPQYKKQGSDQWLRNGTLRYPEWKFEQAGFVYDKEKLPHGELKYENIDYLSISI